MNEQIVAVIKSLLISLGTTLLVQRGWIDSDTLQKAVGAVVLLASVGWAVYARRKSGIINSAAKLPEVQQVVVTDPALVEKATRAEVTGPTSKTKGSK